MLFWAVLELLFFSFFFEKKMNSDFFILFLCLDYTSILFIFGLCGLIINRRNILLMLISLEITFLASALNFIFVSAAVPVLGSWVYCLLILLIVIIDTVFGLSLVLFCYRSSKVVTINTLCAL